LQKKKQTFKITIPLHIMQMDTEQELMIEEEKREQSNEKNEEA
jgi:hypothetical protein